MTTNEGNPEGFDPTSAVWEDVEPWAAEKEWTAEELSEIAASQVAYLGYWLVPPRHRKYVADPAGTRVFVGEFSEGRGMQARVENNPRKGLDIYFDVDTFEEQFIGMAAPEGIEEEDVARLYMGTGIAIHLLLERQPYILPDSRAKIRELLDEPKQMPDGLVDSLDEAIANAHDLDEHEKYELRLSVAHLDDRPYVNGMRFAIGLLLHNEEKLLAKETSAWALHPISQSCRDMLKKRLKMELEDVELRMKLKKINQYEARRDFSHSLSEFELAAAFPMSPAQVREILNLCRS